MKIALKQLIILAIVLITHSSCATLGESASKHQESDSTPIASSIHRLNTFARIAADVRYFHPSDGVESTDWDQFLAIGMLEASNSTDESFAEVLRKLFAEIAPSLKVNGKTCSMGTVTASNQLKVWAQYGYIEDQDYDPNTSAYQRKRITVPSSQLGAEEIYYAKYGDIEIHLPLVVFVDENGKTLPISNGFVDTI
jgi:hypothetical protein